MANSSDILSAITAANENSMALFKQGDAAGIAALYTKDGQLLPPNSDFLIGAESIQGFWQALMDMGIKEINLETLEAEQHGDTAIEVSKFSLHGGDGKTLNYGKYIVIWKHEDGQWKLHRDIFNHSMPAA